MSDSREKHQCPFNNQRVCFCPTTAWRCMHWKYGIDTGISAPLGGLGLSSSSAYQAQTQSAAQQTIHNQEYLAYMASMQAQASPSMLNALGMGLAAQAQQFMPSFALHPDRINALVQEAEREAQGWRARSKRPPLKVWLYMLMFRIFHLLIGRYPWETPS